MDDEKKTREQLVDELVVSRQRITSLEASENQLKQAEKARLAANAELQEMRRYLTRLIDSSTDAIISTDKEGNVVLFNEGAEALLGYRAEEVIGQRVTMLYESEERAKDIMRQMRKRGGTVSAFETALRAKDGSSIPVLISASILHGEAGQEAGTVGFNTDLRERKRVEEALQRAHDELEKRVEERTADLDKARERLQYLLTVTPGVIYTNQASGDFACTFVSENLHSIMGYTPREMLDDPKFWSSRLHPEDAPRVFPEVYHLISKGGGTTEYRFRHRQEHYIWIHDTFKVIHDEAGRPLEIVGSWADITNRKLAEAEVQKAKEAAEEATRVKSDFLAKMSHELRTPLNAIIGYSEMLQEEAEDLGQENFVTDLQKIHGAGRHLLGLINDILDLSKIEAGKMGLYLENFDIAPMIQDVVATISPLVEKNANTLEVHCADDLGAMRADLTKVRQGLFNLLSNACKFAERGIITLGANREMVDGAAWIKFRVSDTGIGMTAEQMGNLFEAFSQAEASTTRKYGGTGLGLAISKIFCQMMGGDVTVESALGQGSTFTILLPAEVVDPEAAPAPGPEEIPAAAVSRTEGAPTVLVIDDDPRVHDLMQRFLSKEGLQMVAALDGEEGLRLAKTVRPAVITLDVLMPGMDGWAVLSALKSDPELTDIPVIMITMLDETQMGYALGASDYLAKPIEWKRLAAILQKYRCARPPCPVLIVEDDAEMRELLRRRLEKEGWTVSEAENGRVALERMAENLPELILLDLMMPEMDGFQFLEEVRKRDAWPSIPIVVLTAKELTADDRTRLKSSVIQILQKGAYTQEELLFAVRNLVASCVRPGDRGTEDPPYAKDPASGR
jgi:PAS domain S-box-containing protein